MKVMTQKQAQRAGASDMAADILSALPQAVIVFDKNLNIVQRNAAAQNISTLGGEDHPLRNAAVRVVETGRPVTLHDVAFNGKMAQTIAVQFLVDGMYMAVINFYSPYVKTHWMEQTRQSLLPAQTMARMLAHEIKNPLAGIQGAAQILSRSLKGDDGELAMLIQSESERILRLVEKTDIFESLAPENFQSVNLHEVMAQVAGLARASFAANIDIEERYDPSLPEVRGDFDALVQAVMNLVCNAVDAAPEKNGNIVLRSFYDVSAPVHPETLKKLPLCIEIKDNGGGIDPALILRIFDPYFTTKSEGEGLGLAVVSRIVDDHGGTLDVKTGAAGSRFILSFPVGDIS